MKRFLMAIAVAGVMSVSALAGDMPTGDLASPAPGPHRTTSISQGQISQVSSSELAQASRDAVQTVLLTILSLLAR